MKQKLIEENWVQRIIRIRQDYIKVCSYLEFVAKSKELDYNLFVNEMFEFSLNNLLENGFHYCIKEYKPRRVPKGFFIDSEKNNKFNETYYFYSKVFNKKFNRKLYICEYVELIIYIYVINNLSEEELKTIGIEWGIDEY